MSYVAEFINSEPQKSPLHRTTFGGLTSACLAVIFEGGGAGSFKRSTSSSTRFSGSGWV